jgi:hypothetical protein
MVLSAAAGFFFEMIPTLKPLLSGGTIPAFLTSLIVILIGLMVGKPNKNNNASISEA